MEIRVIMDTGATGHVMIEILFLLREVGARWRAQEILSQRAESESGTCERRQSHSKQVQAFVRASNSAVRT